MCWWPGDMFGEGWGTQWEMHTALEVWRVHKEFRVAAPTIPLSARTAPHASGAHPPTHPPHTAPPLATNTPHTHPPYFSGPTPAPSLRHTHTLSCSPPATHLLVQNQPPPRPPCIRGTPTRPIQPPLPTPPPARPPSHTVPAPPPGCWPWGSGWRGRAPSPGDTGAARWPGPRRPPAAHALHPAWPAAVGGGREG